MNTADFEEEVFETKESSPTMRIAIAGVCLTLSWGLALFFGRQADVGTRVLLISLGTGVAVYVVWETLVRLRIGRSELVAEYLVRKRTVRYADIVEIAVDTEHAAGPTRNIGYDVIVITRRHGFSVVLRDFDDEIAGPFGALQRRWSSWMDHAHPHWRDKAPRER